MVLVSSTASTAHYGVCCVSSCLWHPAQNSWPSRWLLSGWLLSRWLLSRCAGSQTAWWQPTLDVRRRGPGLTLTPVLTPDSEARLRWPVIASPYKEPEPAPHPECMSHMSHIVTYCHDLAVSSCSNGCFRYINNLIHWFCDTRTFWGLKLMNTLENFSALSKHVLRKESLDGWKLCLTWRPKDDSANQEVPDYKSSAESPPPAADQLLHNSYEEFEVNNRFYNKNE